ncbi:MAG TPA: FadR/GntR family transcriptional regulator [Oxalicibacterium sp.]|jgi:GntR family transcriptional repressor for pyruvate dehydrogenase complex|nr:FadR/GntR family transcriptional regulator [Oxalicibacterium sp.]
MKLNIHAPRLSEAVHRELERRILDGELPSGEKLPTEHALAEHFTVSRSVVREAVARLKAEGLVEARQGAGTFVARQPRVLNFGRVEREAPPELVQVMELRRIVEVAVAGLAAERRSASDLAAIRASLDAMDKALTLGENGAQADDAFHETIAAAAKNPYLQRVVNFVSAQFSESRRLTWAPADYPDLRQRAQSEHHKLFDAIVARDAVAARRYAAAHLDGVEARLGTAGAPRKKKKF